MDVEAGGKDREVVARESSSFLTSGTTTVLLFFSRLITKSEWSKPLQITSFSQLSFFIEESVFPSELLERRIEIRGSDSPPVATGA